MKKLGQTLNKFVDGVVWVNFVDVAFPMLSNVADVVMDKLTGQSIPGVYKISQSTPMCTAFTSLTYGQVYKTRIHTTLFIGRSPSRSKFIPFSLGNLLSIVPADITTYATFLRANHQLTNRAVSDILRYSIAPFYYIEAVCMIVFMAIFLYDTILSLMTIFKGECAQETSSHRWSY